MTTTGHRTRDLAIRSRETDRMTKRTKRQVNKLLVEFAAEPLEAVRLAMIGRIARLELLCQRCEVGLLAAEDLGQTVDGLQRFALGAWNAWRRNVELLTLLEKQAGADDRAGITCGGCGARFSDLASYTAHRAHCQTEAPDAP